MWTSKYFCMSLVSICVKSDVHVACKRGHSYLTLHLSCRKGLENFCLKIFWFLHNLRSVACVWMFCFVCVVGSCICISICFSINLITEASLLSTPYGMEALKIYLSNCCFIGNVVFCIYRKSPVFC